MASLLIGACAATPSKAAPKISKRVTASHSSPKFPLQQPHQPPPRGGKVLQGIVGMLVWVDETGVPRKVIVGKSSGHPELDQSATDVLAYWRLVPGTIDGVPTAMWNCFSITFYDTNKRYLPTAKDKADQVVFDQQCKEHRPVLPARPAPVPSASESEGTQP